MFVKRIFSWHNLLITFSIFFLTRVFVMYCALYSGFDFFDYHDYSRWDSGHYLSIANTGYILKTCADDYYNPNPDNWCGNCGWMPLYSYFIHALKFTGLDPVISGYFLSALFQFAFLFLLYAVLLNGVLNLKNCMILLSSVFFFGSIYYQAIFPVSMFLFFVLLMIVFIRKKKITAASVAGAFASATYSSGIWLVAVVVLYLLLENRKKNILAYIKKNCLQQSYHQQWFWLGDAESKNCNRKMEFLLSCTGKLWAWN